MTFSDLFLLVILVTLILSVICVMEGLIENGKGRSYDDYDYDYWLSRVQSWRRR